VERKEKDEKDKNKWNEFGVGKCEEKRNEEKKNERDLVYLGLCYFGTIF
jgi:hypothetical protein